MPVSKLSKPFHRKTMRERQQLLPLQQGLPCLIHLLPFTIGATEKKTHGDGVHTRAAVGVKQIQVGKILIQTGSIIGVGKIPALALLQNEARHEGSEGDLRVFQP